MPYEDYFIGKYRLEEDVTHRTVRLFDGKDRVFSFEVMTWRDLARVKNGNGVVDREVWKVIDEYLSLKGFTLVEFERGRNHEIHIHKLKGST